MAEGSLQRLTAFSDVAEGGNPAGVWLGPALPTADEMLRTAAEVGYSETVFASREESARSSEEGSGDDDPSLDVRYFSPEREVTFCGHATIALGARLAAERGAGRYILHTAAGDVPVDASVADGVARATLTSVEPTTRPAPAALVASAMGTLGWTGDDLDSTFPPAVASAGADHLLLTVSSRARLASVDYDFDPLRDLMLGEGLTTVALLWRESAGVVHARNLFPVGGVVEDPATGAAAAALGGHLRLIGELDGPADFIVHQGVDMGRPSLLEVHVPATGGIEVSGAAVALGREGDREG
jgi:PhzF family phenazine biosynthesis protein